MTTRLVNLPIEILRELLIYSDYRINILNLLFTNSIFSLSLTRNDVQLLMDNHCRLHYQYRSYYYKLPDGKRHGLFVNLYQYYNKVCAIGIYDNGRYTEKVRYKHDGSIHR